MSKCPVCDLELVLQGALHEDGSLQCPDKHYYYEHSYGAHQLVISLDGSGYVELRMAWHYSETEDERRHRVATETSFLEYLKAIPRQRA